MDSVGTRYICWNMLEHPGKTIPKTHLSVGTLKLFRSMLERSNEIVKH